VSWPDSPGVGGAFAGDFGRFERDGRVALTVETLRAFLPDAEAPAPGSIVAESEKKNGIVRGLGRGWSSYGLLGRRWGLACGSARTNEDQASKNQEKARCSSRLGQVDLRDKRGYPEGRR